MRKEGFDILCIRENTEGEYSGAGGRVHVGTPDEVAVETAIFTRVGVERILRFGFEQARARRGKLASVTKSNAQKHTMVFWDEMTTAIAADYPDVEVTPYHIDAMAARMVMAPETLDVVVASNLFGDILTDLGGHPGRARLCRLGQHQPRPHRALDVRAGARLGARHRAFGHRQPDRDDLVRRDDAGAPRRARGGGAADVMRAVEAATARGIGTRARTDRTDAIANAVLQALAEGLKAAVGRPSNSYDLHIIVMGG